MKQNSPMFRNHFCTTFAKQSGNDLSVFDEIHYFTDSKRVSFNIGFGVFEARAYLRVIKRPELIEPSGFFSTTKRSLKASLSTLLRHLYIQIHTIGMWVFAHWSKIIYLLLQIVLFQLHFPLEIYKRKYVPKLLYRLKPA